MNQDRRTTFRCVSPSTQEPAILRAGRKNVSARVVEESAEGMGVRIEGRELSVKTGEVVLLTMASRRVSARVVHIKADNGDKDQERGQRLGLVKLRDLGFAPQRGDRGGWRAAGGLGSGVMQFTMALAVCVGMFLGGLVFDFGKFGLPNPFANNRAAPLAVTAPDLRDASQRLVGKEKQLADSILRFDDLTSEEFARWLQLNPRQQDRIGRIVDETISVMSLLHSNRSDQTDEAWAEMGMQTLHASWKQIQRELTPEQRDKWAKVSSL